MLTDFESVRQLNKMKEIKLTADPTRCAICHFLIFIKKHMVLFSLHWKALFHYSGRI